MERPIVPGNLPVAPSNPNIDTDPPPATIFTGVPFISCGSGLQPRQVSKTSKINLSVLFNLLKAIQIERLPVGAEAPTHMKLDVLTTGFRFSFFMSM